MPGWLAKLSEGRFFLERLDGVALYDSGPSRAPRALEPLI